MAIGDKLERLLETISDRIQSTNTEKGASSSSTMIDAESIEKSERVLNAYQRFIALPSE